MNTHTSKSLGSVSALCGLLLVVAGCSTSTDSGPDCRYNEAWENGQCSVDLAPPVRPSGIWRGADSAGADVLLLVSVGGTFHFVDAAGNQGSGFLAPGPGIASGFDLVSPLGQSFADGTTLANCSFTGSLVERRSIAVTLSCLTSTGLRFSETLALDFDALYDRGSSLAAIAGNFQMPSGSVLSIAADGAVFMQDATTGCITNGRISVMAADSNLYRILLQHDSCTGPQAILNGADFRGFALLDDTGATDTIVLATIGDAAVALLQQGTRL